MTNHEVLVAARNLLDQRGWTRESPRGPEEIQCAMGALAVAAELPWVPYREAYCIPYPDVRGLPAAELLSRLAGWRTLEYWNDIPGRTKEEVLALFDTAIAQTAPQPDLSFLRDEVPA